MKKINKIIIISLFIALILYTAFNTTLRADNGAAYETVTVDASGNFITTQDAYLAVKTVREIPLTNSSLHTLSTPEDIYYSTETKMFYIADTKNARVVVADSAFSSGFAVGEGILKKPRGVFANAEGIIYVADYELKAVAIFDPADLDNPRLVTSPTHPLYVESSSTFAPNKIVVDPVGTMYIIDAGNSNGIVMITKDGQFTGYFGANYVRQSFSYYLKFFFATKEQRKKLYASPVSPTNLAIDQDGLINTISNIKGSSIKKLNIAGNNLLPTNMIDWTDYVDLCIGPTGTIYAIEKSGWITEYDKEGNLLFDFGGTDVTGTTVGLFKNATSIAADDNHSLFVLDADQIQIFVQTEFASLIHEALELYNDGKYEESRAPWEEVLKLNSMFDLAHRGLGNAYLRERNYKAALTEFKLAKDTESYSNAFSEIRSNWLNKYGYIAIIIIIVLIIAFIILTKIGLLNGLKTKIRALKDKINNNNFLRQLFFPLSFIRKPLKGFYEIRRHDALSIPVATIWYIWFFVLTLIASYFTGFVFNPSDKETITLVNVAVESILPLLLFVVANYLISSITGGSGRFRDVYAGAICSLVPYLVFMPIVIILSNFIVSSEAFFYNIPKIVLWGWSFALLFFMIKDIEELGFGENFKNIFLTIVAMVLFVAFMFLMYVLCKEFFDFIKSIIREVFSRG